MGSLARYQVYRVFRDGNPEDVGEPQTTIASATEKAEAIRKELRRDFWPTMGPGHFYVGVRDLLDPERGDCEGDDEEED